MKRQAYLPTKVFVHLALAHGATQQKLVLIAAQISAYLPSIVIIANVHNLLKLLLKIPYYLLKISATENLIEITQQPS